MSKRSNMKHPGLSKITTLPIRQDLTDSDYVDNIKNNKHLSKEEKDAALQFLNDFNEEWINCNIKKGKARFHKTFKERKKINDMNNARNRDVYSRNKARGTLAFYLDIEKQNTYEIEDDLNYKIDEDTKIIKNLKNLKPSK